MKRVAVVACGVLFMNVYAFAGVVTFTPEKVTVNPAVDGPLVKFGLTLASVTPATSGGILDGVGLTTFTAIVGSDDAGISFDSFTFSSDVLALNLLTSSANAVGKYAGDDRKITFATNFFVPPVDTFQPVFPIGSLVVDVSALAPGSYDIVIDGTSLTDGAQSKVVGNIPTPNTEPLLGLGTINVVPEPATVTLLGLASLALLRRRKRA